eukprot:gene13650-13773_t
MLLMLGSGVRRWAVDDEAERQGAGWWHDLYQVCQWVFGQEFPAADSSLPQQVFAVFTAMIGLAAFALVLAVVEQVVLEGMEANVKRGSHVYESGHVVVMTQRSKLEMEGIFWRCLPACQRHGTKLVFRQGSPLVTSDLRMVGASRAAATVIVSDQSRSAAEADAQAVRCAILLDELEDAGHSGQSSQLLSPMTAAELSEAGACAAGGQTGSMAAHTIVDKSLSGKHVVVELKTSNALPLLKYACSNRVIAAPTNQLNAQRLAKMVKRPVISIVSQQLFNFENRVSIYIHDFPHLVGRHFGDLAFLFPDGIVMGLVDTVTGKAMHYGPLDNLPEVQTLVKMFAGRLLQPAQHARTASTYQVDTSFNEAYITTLAGEWTKTSWTNQISSRSKHGNCMGAAYQGSRNQSTVRNWGQVPSQVEALKQQAQAEAEAIARGAKVGLGCHSDQQWNNVLPAGRLAGLTSAPSSQAGVAARNRNPCRAGEMWNNGDTSQQCIAHSTSSPPAMGGGDVGAAAAAAAVTAMQTAPHCSNLTISGNHGTNSPAATILTQVDDGPEKVLVCGWGPNCLMADLIKELDHGLSALPAGSEVVFVHTHPPDESLEPVLQGLSLENLTVRHVHANPLLRSSLASKLDLASFRCCLCLCDELWVDPDSNDANGIESLDEPSVLRLDSLVMVTQLNIRKLLEDSQLPPINIICQKVATDGLTRFEDRHRLPLGVSVNFNSFAAKMLAQIAASPLMLVPVTRLGEDAELTIMDSSNYTAHGEEVSFWDLVVRCQDVGDVLLGYYHIPDRLDQPLSTVVNPLGFEERSQARVWNTGDGRLKFIVLQHRAHLPGHNSSGSVDDQELLNTQQARWVALAASVRLESPSAANSCS